MRRWWRWMANPLAALCWGVGFLLLIFLLSKLLLALFYIAGGVLILLVVLWFLWRWLG
ncbi:hypothetical protein [Cohnella pontilimi]|uniref:hypothetical protein n=1 Tax=Cohnella pontilimi TaxID=2564100 RepID=UPI00145E58D4|nr:hypothetical protein [Cohnella pontilimi]